LRLIGRKPGLTNRITAGFALISLVVALVVSAATYLSVRVYLVQERETAALSRALIDARVVDAALSDGKQPVRALGNLPASRDSQSLLNVGGQWFSSSVTVSPNDLPPGLLDQAEPNGAWQRFAVEETTLLGVAVPVTGGQFVETFSFMELDQTLAVLGWVLAFASLVSFIVGGLIGRYAGHRILLPLVALADGARKITAGDLHARVPVDDDPDLSAISTAFNEMADAVEDRIERERRFSGNVSHELRSPLTGILGTAELLEHRRERLPEREATLVTALVTQVRRFSATVLDLLEISRIGGDETIQHESIDVGALIDDVLGNRGLPSELHAGTAVRITTDPRRLERVVSNLVENAERHGDGLRRIAVESGPETTRIVVDDAGPGIAEEMSGQIFEPFSRGDVTSQDGAGLGLAIVREQVRLLGGEVAVQTSPQGGARLVVTLMKGEHDT
jgi:two-component system sensor histidine kinase MtrB